MWCAIRVNSSDGQALWLTDADSTGARSVDEFKKAAIFWRREHAQAALDLFSRRNPASASRLLIVEIGEDIFKQESGNSPASR
jgi:hypothetical protein